MLRHACSSAGVVTFRARQLMTMGSFPFRSGDSMIHAASGPVLGTVLSLEPGTAVAQWLRCCAKNRKVAGSIPDGVIGIFR